MADILDHVAKPPPFTHLVSFFIPLCRLGQGRIFFSFLLLYPHASDPKSKQETRQRGTSLGFFSVLVHTVPRKKPSLVRGHFCPAFLHLSKRHSHQSSRRAWGLFLTLLFSQGRNKVLRHQACGSHPFTTARTPARLVVSPRASARGEHV